MLKFHANLNKACIINSNTVFPPMKRGLMDQFENTLCNTSGKKSKRSINLKRGIFCFPLFKEKYMSHLYGTREITITWQFAFCLVGNRFLEAKKSQSIEIIAGYELLHEPHCFCLKHANSYSLILVVKAAYLKHYKFLFSFKAHIETYCLFGVGRGSFYLHKGNYFNLSRGNLWIGRKKFT